MKIRYIGDYSELMNNFLKNLHKICTSIYLWLIFCGYFLYIFLTEKNFILINFILMIIGTIIISFIIIGFGCIIIETFRAIAIYLRTFWSNYTAIDNDVIKEGELDKVRQMRSNSNNETSVNNNTYNGDITQFNTPSDDNFEFTDSYLETHVQHPKYYNIKNLIQIIENYQSLREYSHERYYHHNLWDYLKKYCPDVEYEEQTSESRPDLIIGTNYIAIEVKGPTRSPELDDIYYKKCKKYSERYKYIIVVLFDLHVSDKKYLWFHHNMSRDYPNIKVIIKNKQHNHSS